MVDSVLILRQPYESLKGVAMRMIGITIATAVVTALIVYLQKREARSHTVGPDKFLQGGTVTVIDGEALEAELTQSQCKKIR